MALIKCPECGCEISDSAPSCPHCGFVMTSLRDSKVSLAMAEEKRAKRSRLGTRLIVLAVISFSIALFIAAYYHSTDLNISAAYYFGHVSRAEYYGMKFRSILEDFLLYAAIGLILIGIVLKVIYRRKE